MAKFIGHAGGFLKERAIERRLNYLLTLFILMAGVFFLIGFAAGKKTPWLSLAAVAFVVPSFKVFERLMEHQLRMARSDEHGVDGEMKILRFLRKLPDTFTVLCDLDFADSYGNIDQLVVGPTGVFALDAKNWRGVVSSDGKGELLFNGRPTDKPHVRYFTRRVMDLKNRLKALTLLDPYVQCVFVFLHTRVDANWGATGAVHCIRVEQLEDYIAKGHGGKSLHAADISRLVAAAEALKRLAGGDAERPQSQDRLPADGGG